MFLTDKGKDFYYGEDVHAFGKSYECQDIYAFLDLIYDFFHDRENYDSKLQMDAVVISCIVL